MDSSEDGTSWVKPEEQFKATESVHRKRKRRPKPQTTMSRFLTKRKDKPQGEAKVNSGALDQSRNHTATIVGGRKRKTPTPSTPSRPPAGGNLATSLHIGKPRGPTLGKGLWTLPTTAGGLQTTTGVDSIAGPGTVPVSSKIY